MCLHFYRHVAFDEGLPPGHQPEQTSLPWLPLHFYAEEEVAKREGRFPVLHEGCRGNAQFWLQSRRNQSTIYTRTRQSFACRSSCRRSRLSHQASKEEVENRNIFLFFLHLLSISCHWVELLTCYLWSCSIFGLFACLFALHQLTLSGVVIVMVLLNYLKIT